MRNHLSTPHLLVIPGLGDRVWLYRAVVPLWRNLGYEISLHAFGWNGELAELGERQRRLVGYVNALRPGRVFVIGASAGGVAAVNLLAECPEIQRVITVASPLLPKDIPTKELLVASFRQAAQFLDGSDEKTRNKLVSVHGRYDNRVPVELSQRTGIRNVELPTYGHGPTIFSALTVHRALLRAFMQ